MEASLINSAYSGLTSLKKTIKSKDTMDKIQSLIIICQKNLPQQKVTFPAVAKA